MKKRLMVGKIEKGVITSNLSTDIFTPEKTYTVQDTGKVPSKNGAPDWDWIKENEGQNESTPFTFKEGVDYHYILDSENFAIYVKDDNDEFYEMSMYELE